MSLPTAINASPHRTGKRELTLFFALVAVVFVTRIPFLSAGYGISPDAWHVVSSVQNFVTTGKYIPARLPGNPLYEISLAFVAFGGPSVTNALSALMSALAIGFFALSLRALGSKDSVLAALALGFVPIIYFAGATTLDYGWSFAFMIASLYGVLVRKPWLSGLTLGAAIGSRLTYAAMLVPMGILVASRNANWKRDFVAFLMPVAIVSGLAFTPIFLRYGFGFLRATTYGYPSLRAILNNGIIGVWGLLGAAGISVAVAVTVVRRRIASASSSIPATLPPFHLIAWGIAISIYSLAFLVLPLTPYYLLPIIPFVILFLARFLERRVFIVICLALIASPFLASLTRTQLPNSRVYSNVSIVLPLIGGPFVIDFLYGPVVMDHLHRLEQQEIVQAALAYPEISQDKVVLIVGEWMPILRVYLSPQTLGNVRYEDYLSAAALQKYAGEGYAIYYLPGADESNRLVQGVDLHDFGAQPFVPRFQR